MAKPAKTLKNISVGGETYKICPVMLQDGSTNYIATLPTLTADSTIALTSNLTNRVKYDDTMMETNPFGGQKLYINTLYNAFANADKKFYVTITKHKKSDNGVTYPYTDSSKTIEDDNYYVDGPVVATLTTSAHNLFNGSYEDSINLDNDGSTYLKIRIMFGSNTSPSASSSYFLGYPYGYWYISYYYNNTPNTAAQVRVYNKYATHTKGWHLYTASWWKGQASGTNVIQLVSDTMDYQRTCVDFIIYGNNTSGRTVNVTQIDYKLQRPNLARDGSTLTKFGPMDLYENFAWYKEHKKTLQIAADGTITGYNSSGDTEITIAGSSGNITTTGKITANGNVEAGAFKENNVLLTDKYVRTDTNTQGLTDAKKANARANIEAKQIPFEAIENIDYVYNSSLEELTNISNNFKAALEARRDFSYTAPFLDNTAKILMHFNGEATTNEGTLLEYTSELSALGEFIHYAIVMLYSGGTVNISFKTQFLPEGLTLGSTGNLGFWDGDMIEPYAHTVSSSAIVNAGVPTHSLSDAGKVLSIDSNGYLTWNDGISGPMIFKGTLGTGGTITTLPAASASNVGYTYKVITAGTYQSIAAKVGDLFVSTAGSNSTYSWTLIPAGDELTDVQINGTSIVNPSTNIANFNTQSAYNASTNKLATVEDTKIKTITIAASQAVSDTEFVLTNEQFNIIQNNEVVNIATDWWPLHTVYRSFKDYVGTYTAFSRMQLNGIDDAELEESHIIVVTNSERVDYKHAYLIEHVIVDANPTTSVSTPDLTSITIRGTNYKIPITSLSINDTNIAPVSGNINLVTNQAYDASTNKIATMTDVNKKLDKLTYEWNKEVAMGSSGYIKIGSFPMYDTNITIDIDATTSTSYHGTAIVVTQNTSTSSMGSAHKVDVYGDPTGIIASSLRIVWTNGSRNYDIYFVPQSWSKNVIHIRAVALSSAPDESTICQKITSGTAPTTTSGISINNILNVKDVQVNGTSVANSGVVNLITNSAYNASSNKIATMSDIPGGTVTSVDMSVPTGFTVSGNPITTSGTFNIALASGYELLNSNSAQTIAGEKLFTSSVTLYNSSNGDTPMLIFRRGTLTDNYNDWAIVDSAGLLYLKQRGSGSTSWNDNRVIFAQAYTDIKGEIKENGTSLASKYVRVDTASQGLTDTQKANARANIGAGTSLPTYDSSKENYVLSVNSSGNLVWKAPYDGTASGS